MVFIPLPNSNQVGQAFESDESCLEDVIPSLFKLRSRWLTVILGLNGILCVCEEFRFWPKEARYLHESQPYLCIVFAKVGPKVVFI